MAATLTPATPSAAPVGPAAEWVTAVAEELGTADRDYAALMLRSWLHLLRDRLTHEVADRFAAELPRGIRKVFVAGWDRSAAPVRSDASAYTIRFGRAAGIAVQDVRPTAAAVTAAVMRLLPPIEVYKALDELSPALRVLINPGAVLHAA